MISKKLVWNKPNPKDEDGDYIFNIKEAAKKVPESVKEIYWAQGKYNNTKGMLELIQIMPDYDCWDQQKKVIIVAHHHE